jgi:hypothetical protein
VGLTWTGRRGRHDEAGLSPQLPATASRASLPVYHDGLQVGKATSSTWSPSLKKMIALATVASEVAAPGSRLQMEMTVDHQRKSVGVTVAKLPFFDPPARRPEGFPSMASISSRLPTASRFRLLPRRRRVVSVLAASGVVGPREPRLLPA